MLKRWLLWGLMILLLTACSHVKTRQHEKIESKLFQDAQASYLLNDYAAANALFSRYLREAPVGQHAEVRMWRGKSLLALGKWEAAVQDFRAGMDMSRDLYIKSQCMVGYADSMRAQEVYHAAIAYYKQALTMTTGQLDEGAVRYKLGLAYIRFGDWTKGRLQMQVVYSQFRKSRYANKAKAILDNRTDYFSVQVATFSSNKTAQSEMKRLRLLGHQPYMKTASSRYVVLVGKDKTWKAARLTLTRIRRLHKDAFIVP